VVNAADAMELVTDRERILRVKTEPDPSFDVRVEVQDSGPGIAAADLDSVFAPFYTTKSKGMGMGLSISRSLIEAHGGRIWATQALPFGTIFTFVLPAADDHSGDAASGPWVGKAATAPAQAE
jgi:signal transduction histidine kinase